jgi:HD-GYP domain-containing protein (c-di-GMP phosphodiesterase class II)
VVDAFDAMSSDRPYRNALPLDETIRQLLDDAGTQWDPYITPRFVDLVECEGLGARAN